METEALVIGSFSDLLNALPAIVAALTAICTAANIITSMTPTTSDDRVVAAILRVLNVLSLNVGKNTNADDPKAQKEPPK